jgi:crotonobetainyl-CoA:carnitine CoA-transferase CaiB-like acyl-CoA transferase
MKALEGLNVVDLSQNLAGPYCTQILSDLGADVIKVEPPGGDPARQWGPPFHDGESTIFRAANRGKRSITLDLKTEAGRETLLRLVARADVFVQSFRAGVIERLGFGAETLRAADPRLIYCSVTAYGTTGPLRDLPGYDPLMQAHGGLIAITGQPGQPARTGTSIIDMGTGLWTAIGVLAALRERDRTGIGSHVVGSLFETALAWNAYHLMGWFAEGYNPTPHGTAFALIAPYGAFTVRDGAVMIAAANDGLFRRLCTALQLDGVEGDDRFASNPARVANRAAIDALVSAATCRYTQEQLLAVLRDAGVPCAPILDVAAVAGDAQTLASGMLASGDGHCPEVLAPLRWDGQRADARAGSPRAGEHTAAILSELGLA